MWKEPDETKDELEKKRQARKERFSKPMIVEDGPKEPRFFVIDFIDLHTMVER